MPSTRLEVTVQSGEKKTNLFYQQPPHPYPSSAEGSIMVNGRHYKPTGEMLDEPAVALFQQQWQLYRKFVDNSYFYHREVYGQLHQILVEEAVQPFRFRDIACGDARATADALKGTRVAPF